MTFSHTTGTYNVEATVTAWLQGVFNTPVPAIGTAIALKVDYPIEPIDCPVVSVSPLGTSNDPQMTWQGGNTITGQVGRGKFGVLEVDLWASRGAQNWRRQLKQLFDLLSKEVTTLLKTGGALNIKDFYTSDTAPQSVAYLVRIDGIEESPTAHDPNPEIERKRIILTYSWVERV